MANTLTSTIAVPNITKIRAKKYAADVDTNTASILVSVEGNGGRIWGEYTVKVANGECQGIRANATPVTFTDRVELFVATHASGFTDMDAIERAAGTRAAKLRAVETQLIAMGLIPTGVVS